MRFSILSLFPDYFTTPFTQSMVAQALKRSLIAIEQVNMRDFAQNKHNRVDDRPFGGGPGMVLQAEPVAQAIASVRRGRSRVIYLSPQGKPLTAERCRALAKEEHLILLCGHYEGIDQRVIDREVDEEISIGDYVVTNGCVAAIVLLDAVIRFVPGVLGDATAADSDSFEGGLLDHPVYTRPEVWEGIPVPAKLLSGHHGEIAEMRVQQKWEKTKNIRPDLYHRRRP